MDEDDAVREVGDQVGYLDIADFELVVEPGKYRVISRLYLLDHALYISPFTKCLLLHFDPIAHKVGQLSCPRIWAKTAPVTTYHDCSSTAMACLHNAISKHNQKELSRTSGGGYRCCSVVGGGES